MIKEKSAIEKRNDDFLKDYQKTRKVTLKTSEKAHLTCGFWAGWKACIDHLMPKDNE